MFTTQYEYDARGRCTKKKLPGADFVEYTYNAADQLVFSQDGNQRAQTTKKWTYYLYDKFGRLTEQGECTNKSATSSPVVYIHNYYDGYGFINGTGFTDSNYKLTEAQKAYGKGYQTGSVISIFGDSKKIYLMYQYDIQGRVVKTVQNNLLDGLDVTETTYTFSSNPQTVVHKNTYKENGTQKSITETYIYTYDYADRISKVEHTLNDTKVVLSENTYNKLGQLVNRSLHGASADIMGYAYNIRNWLTRIESPNLILKLNYGYSAGGGNIASMFWKSGEEGRQKYTFTYDGLGRMLNADHLILGQQDEDDDDWGVTTGLMSIQTGRQIEETPLARENAFTERVTEYDKNGNILKLVRYGQTGANSYGVIDNLTMTLTGNQLNRVDDASTTSAYGGGFEFKDAVKQDNEYAYDANGNLTQDLNKGIEDIQYNFLNLPRLVKFKDQSTITYTYAANGTKLRVEHKIGNSTTRTTYCSNVIYEDGTAKCLLTEEGHVSLDDREYHYYLKDHQGNNRVLVNKNGGVEEINHYYPFGGVFASEENVQPYKYNGKELDTKKGLNWYDYGARRYDAALGRFTTTDRFAEKYYSMSSYQYGGNNPVGNIDVNGDSIVISPNPNGLIDHIKSRFGYDTKFQKTVKADLAQLKKDDKTVAQIILKLEDSENIHQITMVEDRRKVT
nr:RHS repeat-associated core domain-containing protein [Bacteroides intestinalis]